MLSMKSITVRAPKRLDLLTAPSLAHDLEQKICEGQAVILDLTQTKFIDPAIANVFLEGLIKSKQRSARFSLRGVSPQARLVLEMSGVLQHFQRKTKVSQMA